jgi:hypothetical protein
MRSLSTSQFLITIAGYPNPIYFSKKSGGNQKRSTSDYNDGITRANKKVVSPLATDELTLSRAYDPDVDPQFIQFLDRYCPRVNGDLVITVQAIEQCADSNPVGQPWVYSGVQYLGTELPDVDRQGTDAAMVNYLFAVDTVTIG